MQHQPKQSVAEQDAMIDIGILYMLLGPDQRPWSIEEITRDIGDHLKVADSLARLYGAGLIHCLDDFVWASRAAVIGEDRRL